MEAYREKFPISVNAVVLTREGKSITMGGLFPISVCPSPTSSLLVMDSPPSTPTSRSKFMLKSILRLQILYKPTVLDPHLEILPTMSSRDVTFFRAGKFKRAPSTEFRLSSRTS